MDPSGTVASPITLPSGASRRPYLGSRRKLLDKRTEEMNIDYEHFSDEGGEYEWLEVDGDFLHCLHTDLSGRTAVITVPVLSWQRMAEEAARNGRQAGLECHV